MKLIIEEMKRRIDILSNDVNKLAEEMKKVEEESTPEWALKSDRTVFSGFSIRSNYENWKISKKHLDKKSPFYVSTNKTDYTVISLDEAKQLRDYLDEKIQYLES